MPMKVMPTWPRDATRPRVLVESEGGGFQALARRVLEENGYAVATCGGPGTLPRRRCPLVTDGRCALVDGADVVVYALNPDHPENARVLQAIKDCSPETPIVVEIPEPAMARHIELLAGCDLAFPMTWERLLAAVEAAIGETASLGVDGRR